MRRHAFVECRDPAVSTCQVCGEPFGDAAHFAGAFGLPVKPGVVRFNKGDRVSTPLGPGHVAYERLGPPDYTSAEAVSVVLDSRRNQIGYTGTMFAAGEVSAERS